MQRPPALPSALLAVALLSLSAAVADARLADAPDDLRAGREALARGDGPSAVKLLESALISVPEAERPAVLVDLRRAYERAASQAEAAGDARRARSYRENLLIIDRSPRPDAGTSPGQSPPAPAPEPPAATTPPADDPAPTTDVPSGIAAEANTPTAPSEQDRARPSDVEPEVATVPAASPPKSDGAIVRALDLPRSEPSIPDAPEPDSSPSPAPAPSPAEGADPAASTTAAELIRAADAAFREQEYDDAGRIYASLSRRGELPGSHTNVWAYCRFVAVARRINAQPSSPSEWSAIHAEIREVRALAPKIWFSEYLRRLASERSAAVGARPSAFIVRGQSQADESTDDDSPTGSWQVMDTENFRIFHADAALADRVARRAEQARSELLRYWSGSEPAAPWSPRCDVYVYPDAAIFARATGQPTDSPGFSTMGLSGGRVVARRINLRADLSGLVEAVVPHEVAHVVLADLFPTQQVPRWADEGMAVLAEPTDAQAARLADLDGPLASGRVFRSGSLMTAAMPDGRYWDLFMAQSASLTRYLIQLDTPSRFVTFLRESERLGPEPALVRVYGFEGYDDLHARWISHSRRGQDAASSGSIAARPDGAERVR